MSMIRVRLLPIKKHGRFYLPQQMHVNESFLFGTIPSFIQSLLKRRSQRIDADVMRWIIHDGQQNNLFHVANVCTITWIGHSSFLICINGISLLTDPIFGSATWLYPRLVPPGISSKNLPNINYILLSHNHRDHMDARSLHMLKNHGYDRLYVPHGDKQWFDKKGFPNVFEFSWWQSTEYGYNNAHADFRCTFLPAIHWSQRGIFDKNKSLWGSWMIECAGLRIYFAGDTAYSSHFRDIKDEFGTIDTVLMPIGPCEPRAWMQRTHISSHHAVQGFSDLHARQFIPMHWGTFLFGTDHMRAPYEQLCRAWDDAKEQLKDKKLSILKIGQTIDIKMSCAEKPLLLQPDAIMDAPPHEGAIPLN